jgi:hypothetical protein
MVKKISQKNQPKRFNQNGRIQNNWSIMALWSSWTRGQRNHIEEVLTKIPIKKSDDLL